MPANATRDVDLPVSGLLCAWGNAWLAGTATPDDVLRIANGGQRAMRLEPVSASAMSHGTHGYDHPWASHDTRADEPMSAPQNMSDVLGLWRQAGRIRMALPVAGDVRGVGANRAFAAAAVDAGEAIWGEPTNLTQQPRQRLGLVPSLPASISSAAPTLLWRAFQLPPLPGPPQPVLLREAAHQLTDAIRDCASDLTAAQTARSTPAMSREVAQWRVREPSLDLPSSHPAEAVRLLTQAERLHALLGIVAADPAGGAIDRDGVAARDEALRPLWRAVHGARVAGYNALARD